MERLLLVRHGESPWNRAGRVSGWAPIGLTDRGHEQAALVGEHLAAGYDVDRLHASDLRRTTLTARRIADALGVEHDAIRRESAWRERDFGVYQGLTDEEVHEADPDLVERYRRGDGSTAEGLPSGESSAELRERVLDGWARLTDDPAGTVVLVTHSTPIVVVLAHLQGRSLQEGLDAHSPANCSVTEIAWNADAGRATVVDVNRTSFLE